jgi:hypothetical protein
VASILRKVGLLAAMEAAPYVMERIVHMSGAQVHQIRVLQKVDRYRVSYPVPILFRLIKPN